MKQNIMQKNTIPKNAMIQLILGLGALIGSLNVTMFNVALPIMMDCFHTNLSTVQWLTSGYILAAGIITPAAGYLGERFGYKKVFCVALFFVLLFSVLGVFSQNIGMLIVMRILFGFAGGILLPLTLAMLYKFLPADYHAQAAGIWGMANAIGGTLPSVYPALF